MPQPVLSVLIADDEAAIRNGLLNAIPWNDLHAQVIDTAPDGLYALSCIQTYHPDLVIIDIKMPGMDGLEVIRRAKSEGAECRFLILSGYDDFSLAQKAIRYGANGYFLKPLKIDEFKDELNRQFSELLSQKHFSTAKQNIESLMRTSGIFFFNQLIRGEITGPDETARRYSVLNLSVKNSTLRAVVCSCTSSDKSVLIPLLERASRLFHELLSNITFDFWIYQDEQLVLLVNIDQDSDLQKLYQSCVNVAAILNQQPDESKPRFFIGIGQTVSSLAYASTSYQSALLALSYHIYEKDDNIYDSSMICKKEPSFSPESIQIEPLLQALETANESAVASYCHDFIQSLFFVPMPPPDFIRGMCIYLTNHARILFFARHSDLSPAAPVTGEETRFLHSVGDLEHWLISSLTDFSHQYFTQHAHRDPVIETAKQFIQEHISSNIKARDIALAVNLSETYFTTYFKAKTGQNFRDYVLNARIDYAKQLLTRGEMNISEVAYATGYQDYRSFSRAFKNVTGISPSDYESLC